MKAIIFDTLEEFSVLQDRVHRAMVGDGAQQECWCTPIIHPTVDKIAFTVKDEAIPYLTDAELAQVKTLDESWFPVTEKEF